MTLMRAGAGSILVLVTLVACKNETPNETRGQKSSTTRIEARAPLSVEEERIVRVAARLANEAGLSTADLPDIIVERDGPNWIVGFTRLQPNVIGGPGFQVTMDAATQRLVEIGHYQ